VETQIQYSHDPCPKGIVNQLLEIAKENDAMSEIGGATGWRWQEGIISRMPKTKTVAKILKKAYGTDDPCEWLPHINGDLKVFVKNAFNLSRKYSTLSPKDIYEALLIISTHDGRGVTFDELVFRLAYLHFCKNNDYSDEHFIQVDEELILKVSEGWAIKKAKDLLDKFEIKANSDNYYVNEGRTSFSDDLNKYIQEITKYRLGSVGANSHFDMWRSTFVGLSDQEMVELEYKVIEYKKQLLEEIRSRQSRDFREKSLQKTRVFNFTCITLPNQSGESLKWKN
jgi:hypothetical protein